MNETGAPRPVIRSTAVCFFVFGTLLSTWVSRLPVIEHELHLNSAQLGLALLGAPVGQLLAMPLVPSLVDHISSARACRWSAAATSGAVVLIGLARNLAELAGALVLLGGSLGVLDTCMNTQGVGVERMHGRPIMSRLHALYSVGVLTGGLVGALAAGVGIDPFAHFAGVAVLSAPVITLGMRRLLDADFDRAIDVATAAPASGPVSSGRIRLREHPLLLVTGLVAFCALFAEGAADNWSGVYLHQVRHGSYSVAALGTAMVGVGMTVGRLSGDWVISRLGHGRTLVGGAVISSAGMLVVLLGGSLATGLVGYGVLGLGMATLVPIAFVVAGAAPAIPPAWALSRVSAMGYVGQLVSPAAIGIIARGTGLSTALLIPAVLLLLVVPFGLQVRRLAGQSASNAALAAARG